MAHRAETAGDRPSYDQQRLTILDKRAGLALKMSRAGTFKRALTDVSDFGKKVMQRAQFTDMVIGAGMFDHSSSRDFRVPVMLFGVSVMNAGTGSFIHPYIEEHTMGTQLGGTTIEYNPPYLQVDVDLAGEYLDELDGLKASGALPDLKDNYWQITDPTPSLTRAVTVDFREPDA